MMITKKIALFVSIAVMSIGITGIYAQNEPDNYDPMSDQDNERVNTAQNDLMGGLVELVDAYSDASMEHHQNEVIHISKGELRRIVKRKVKEALAEQAAEIDARLMDRLDNLTQMVHDNINDLDEQGRGLRALKSHTLDKINLLDDKISAGAGEHMHDDLTQMVQEKIDLLEEKVSAGAGEHAHDDLTDDQKALIHDKIWQLIDLPIPRKHTHDE